MKFLVQYTPKEGYVPVVRRGKEEIRFLEMLSDGLDLDRLTTSAIERGIRARNTVL